MTSPDGIVMLRIQTSLSPARPPGARGLEKYDISDYAGGNNVILSNVLSEIIFHTIPSLV